MARTCIAPPTSKGSGAMGASWLDTMPARQITDRRSLAQVEPHMQLSLDNGSPPSFAVEHRADDSILWRADRLGNREEQKSRRAEEQKSRWTAPWERFICSSALLLFCSFALPTAESLLR